MFLRKKKVLNLVIYCNIYLITGEPGVPTMIEWLGQELKRGNVFGASPYLVGSCKFIILKQLYRY